MNSLIANNTLINNNKNQNNNEPNYIPLKIKSINSFKNIQNEKKSKSKVLNNKKKEIIYENILLSKDKSQNSLNNDKFNNNKTSKNLIKVNKIDAKNKYNDNFKQKLIFLQIWWKTLFLIIKIQKNIRGYLFRLKLLIFLDKSEKLYDISLKFFFYIKKYICKRPFNIFINNLHNIKSKNFLNFRKNKINNFYQKNKTIKKNENGNFTKIIKKEKKLNTLKIHKGKNHYKEKNKSIVVLEKKDDYFKQIFQVNKEILDKTALIRNQNNLITIINNTNNIYNNIINPNKKIKNSLIYKNQKSSKIHKDIIINKLSKKEIDKINLFRYFNFWKIKNKKLIIIKKLYGLNLLTKCLLKLCYNHEKKSNAIFFSNLKKLWSFISLKILFYSFYSRIFKIKYLYKLFKKHSKHCIENKIIKYNQKLKDSKSLKFGFKRTKKINHKLFDITIDLKYNEINNTLKEKLDSIKNSSFNWPNSLRNSKSNNIFSIYKNFSKSSKSFYPSKYKKIKANDNVNYSSELNIKKNNNYSNDSSFNANIIKSTINNTIISNANNFNDSLIDNKKINKFVYHRKKISNSLLNINNKNKYNNSSCSLNQDFNEENRIEEKEVFFNRIKNKKDNIINRNAISLRAHLKIRNHSALNNKNCLPKKNSFYKKFGDIIHSAI